MRGAAGLSGTLLAWVHVLVATGIVAVLSTDQFGGATALLALALLLATALSRHGMLHIPRPAALALSAVVGGTVLSDLLIFSAGLPNDAYLAHVALNVQLTLLLVPGSTGLYRALAGVSFLQLVSAASLTNGISFLFISIMYVIAATAVLVLFQIEDGMRRTARTAENQWRHLVSGSVVRRTLAVAVLVFGFNAGIFFVIPRWGAGYFFSRGEEVQTVTGFTEDVRLGDLGEIMQSDEIVMRVALPGRQSPPDGPLYWRGVGLDRYDGRSWKRGDIQVRPLVREDRGFQDRVYSLLQGRWVEKCQEQLAQQVYLNSPHTAVAFGAPRLISLMGKFSKITLDGNGSVRVEFPAFSGYHYEVRSACRCWTPDGLRTAAPTPGRDGRLRGGLPEAQKAAYLQLPDPMERVKTLARQAAAGATNDYDRARAIERFLTTGFRYTLDLTGFDSVRPLDDFLFRKKAGHCEFFATAMVVMLRTLGTPARLVNGYQQGEWNPIGKYFIVRASDAHSWVEVFFPRQGWVEFDPTPPDGRIGSTRQSAYSEFLLALDALRLWWRRSIIQYNLVNQVEYLRAAADLARRLWDEAVAFWLAARRGFAALTAASDDEARAFWRTAAPILLAGLLLLPLGKRALSRRVTRGVKRESRAAAIAFFLRLMKLLRRHGHERSPAQTPRELVREVAATNPPALASLPRIVDAYYRVRYRDAELTDDEMAAIDRELEALERDFTGTAAVPPCPGDRRSA